MRAACSKPASEVTSLTVSRFLVALTLCLSTVAPPLLAQQASGTETRASARVKLRYEEPEPRLVAQLLTRLRAELRVGGFGVVMDEPAAEIAVSANGDQLQLDITTSASGTSSHAVLTGTEREIPLLALQATEFLRAGLLPRVAPAQPIPRIEPPSAEPVSPAPALRSGSWLIDLGCGFLTGFRAGDHLPLVSLGVAHRFPERLALGVGGDIPLGNATFEASRGSANYRIWLATLHADYGWWRSSRGAASLGLELGGARVSSDGRPEAPLEARHPSRFALSLGARLAAELRLTAEVALLAQARVVSLSPTPLIAVIGDQRALGSPSVMFGLGVRIGGG